MSPVPEARVLAEAKLAAVLERLTECERALLFWLLRHGYDWTTDRALMVLKRGKWWLT